MRKNGTEMRSDRSGASTFVLYQKGSTALEQIRRDRNEVEINLGDVFQILLSKWIYILLAGVLVAVAVGLITHFVIKKKYTASVTMYVFTTAEQNQTGSISYSELNAADNLIKTYQVIVKSNSVLDVIAERFNAEHPEYAEYGITTASLGKLCSASVPTNTKLIEVDVKTTDPILSATIANTFAKYAPSEIVRITKAGGVEIVDWAIVPKTASSPNLTRNIVIGILAGIALAAAFFILKTYLDTTIYTSEEVHKVSRCPIIGTVPMIIIGSEEITPWSVSLREEITNE
jgi:capsular polysaccharide biosynthesis protein